MYSLKYMYVKKIDNPENTWKIHVMFFTNKGYTFFAHELQQTVLMDSELFFYTTLMSYQDPYVISTAPA